MDSLSFPYKEFTPAQSRRKRKNRPLHEAPLVSSLFQRDRSDLLSDDWAARCRNTLRYALADILLPVSVLCLGLGSPATSRDARAQLIYILDMCEELEINPERVNIYDPVFSKDDFALFESLGVSPLTEDKLGKHLIDAPTLIFMPHCDIHLYENLLRENWTADRLSYLLIVANELAGTPSRKLSAEYPCLARIVPCLDTRPLPVSEKFSTAFNNIAIQFVRRSSLTTPGGEEGFTFWSLSNEDVTSV